MENLEEKYVNARINQSAAELSVTPATIVELFLTALWKRALAEGGSDTIRNLLHGYLLSPNVNSSVLADVFSKMGVKDFTARLPGSNVIYISEGPVKLEEEHDLNFSWVPETTSISSPCLSFDVRRRVSRIEIPGTVETIGEHAFAWTAIREMVFPPRIKEIPSGVCCGCSELEAVILPEGVTKIGHSAFRYCEKLKEIIIPATVEEIGGLAFERCALPEDVKQRILAIGGAAAFKEVDTEDAKA